MNWSCDRENHSPDTKAAGGARPPRLPRPLLLGALLAWAASSAFFSAVQTFKKIQKFEYAGAADKEGGTKNAKQKQDRQEKQEKQDTLTNSSIQLSIKHLFA